MKNWRVLLLVGDVSDYLRIKSILSEQEFKILYFNELDFMTGGNTGAQIDNVVKLMVHIEEYEQAKGILVALGFGKYFPE